jgi:hypothetical protein
MAIKAKTGTHSRILSVGSYRPKRLVMNSEIVDRIESNDEWIQQRTGIQSRRFADESESVVDMACWAAQSALKRASESQSQILIPSSSPPLHFHIKHRVQQRPLLLALAIPPLPPLILALPVPALAMPSLWLMTLSLPVHPRRCL